MDRFQEVGEYVYLIWLQKLGLLEMAAVYTKIHSGVFRMNLKCRDDKVND